MFKKLAFSLTLILLIGSQVVMADQILFDWGFNVDKTTLLHSMGEDVTSFGQNLDDFNTVTGLGSIIFEISGSGSHNLDAFFDIELNEESDTYFNDKGSQGGTAAAGLSWEIDEPSWSFGDIVFTGDYLDEDGHLYLSNFDNKIFDDNMDFEDDVSVGLGWDFDLLADETATITFNITNSLEEDYSGFYLMHKDMDNSEEVYFTTSLSIEGGPTTVPEPTTCSFLAIGCLFIGFIASKKKQ